MAVDDNVVAPILGKRFKDHECLNGVCLINAITEVGMKWEVGQPDRESFEKSTWTTMWVCDWQLSRDAQIGLSA